MDNPSFFVETLRVGQLETNCYILGERQSNRAVIIDPGDEAQYISETLLRLKIKPELIIATHGHFDHIMASGPLQLNFNLPFVLHEKDAFLVERMVHSAKYHLHMKYIDEPAKITGTVKDGDSFKLGEVIFKIIHTPGHTPGSICIHERVANCLFVGDTIFEAGATGRTDFSYSSKKDLSLSLKKILLLPAKSTIYSGHGPQSTIAKERIYHKIKQYGT